MTVTLADRANVLKEYVDRESTYYKRALSFSKDKISAYTVKAEPISSLFADSVNVNFIGIANYEDPMRAEVQSSVEITWNEPTKKILQRTQDIGLPIESLGRSGGLYQSFCANKRISKLREHMNAIIYDAPQLYRQPWWEEIGKPKYIELERLFEKRGYENLEILKNNPELLTVGKPGTVGTGWPSPFNDRQSMAARFNEIASRIENTTREFYDDYIVAVENWPESGAIIRISGEFKGVKGNRSDVDVAEWKTVNSILDSQFLVSKTREVGNTPGSVLHNKALNPTKWRFEHVLRRVADEYTTFAESIRDHAIYLTTPPATMPGHPQERCTIVSDYGFVNKKPSYVKDRLVLANPDITLPADLTVLSGIEVRSDNGGNRQLVKISGQEDTMDQYRIFAELPFAIQAKEMNLAPKVDYFKEGTGDDIQQVIVRDAIPEFVGSTIGYYMKLKGMQVIGKWHIVFIAGVLCCWNSEEPRKSVWMTVPRSIRSVTSAKMLEKHTDIPSEFKVGDTFRMNVDPTVKVQVNNFFRQYPYLVYFEGDPDQYYDLIVDKYWEGKMALAEFGVSDWLLEFYSMEDIKDLMNIESSGAKRFVFAETEKSDIGVNDTSKVDTTISESDVSLDESEEPTVNITGGNVTMRNIIVTGKTSGLYDIAKSRGLNVTDLSGMTKTDIVEWATTHTLDEGLIGIDGEISSLDVSIPVIYILNVGEEIESISPDKYDKILQDTESPEAILEKVLLFQQQ